MSTRVPTFQTIVAPALLDRALGQISSNMSTKLTWLNGAYGLAQKIIKPDGTYPVIYEENGIDHFPLYPNENLGNFIYFERTERTNFWNYQRRNTINYNETIGMVFWGDLRTIYPADWQQRTREHVRDEVVTALDSGAYTSIQSLQLNAFWYEGNNIYQGHSIKEIDSQYLMRPFVGFRIDFDITYNNENYC